MDSLTLVDTDIKNDPEHYHFEICLDKNGEYRWILKSDNGNIIADSGKGYTTKQSCKNGIAILQTINRATLITDTGKAN
ncbi:YegP family protein [Desulfovibrio gilichinskyi]|uniref:DUF1508 domain-containing protein n=1 Tax=Desulfovibrio gilichinskyi TaxID=1519643 RepID=A0A1X7DIL7_9BACT|nr:DUF1508 domain-containing protein [Desulfovibrio gilichinskyi]SMF15643.1 hypothetical protein SAMN06295933_1916 [Desulfovibrio gilichinskyi]